MFIRNKINYEKKIIFYVCLISEFFGTGRTYFWNSVILSKPMGASITWNRVAWEQIKIGTSVIFLFK